MIEWHKRQFNFWKFKLGISVYEMLWIAFVKGILFSLIPVSLWDSCIR